MNAVYTIKIITDFAAAHLLRDYEGECSRLHGHNWKVEVEVIARVLNEVGMGVDFKDIKAVTREVIGSMDHQNLNDLPPFDKINPTAENLAAHIYKLLGTKLNDDRAQVSAVTIWETERACVKYTEEI
ncbi:MAG: 6-carboxytetrahydropterin synthase QueD [Gammaproteobacteria bacterium]|nr:6-carboxytetrahydropterin synthase QueD [Gammaproteobacteria bacterium]